MDRGGFLKILGISAIAPSVFILDGKSEKDTPIDKFNPKQYPIYPDRISFSVKENENIKRYTMFSYVKINRNKTDYLVPLREWCINDYDLTKKRFEYSAETIKESFVVDESQKFMFDNGFIIKYNPLIHHD